MWNLPHCLGAIDGKHVRIRAFPHSGSANYNYKEFHSLILMAICDAKYRFLAADFGSSGRRGDGNVFYHCAFGQKLRKKMLNIPPPIPADGFRQDADVPFVFVGDAAFSGNSGIISPIPGTLRPDEELVYNYRISRARRVVENAFGILAARFRILQTMIHGSKALVKAVVLACMALHNMHLMQEDSVPPLSRRYFADGPDDYLVSRNGRTQKGRFRNENKKKAATIFHDLQGEVCIVKGLGHPDYKVDMEDVQEMYVEYFINKPVPWQWHSANLIE